jgi:predicted Zn-dependent protease
MVGCLLLPVAYAQRSTETKSASFASLSAKADAARDADRLDEALSLYKKALALRPNWAEGWWSLGTIQYDRNSYAEAAHSFRKVTTFAPKNGTAYVMLGLSEFELGQDDLALPNIQKGVSLGIHKDPELQHVVLYHEGVLLQRRGEFESAREMLQQLCVQGVRSDEVITGLGMSFLRDRGKSSAQASPNSSAVITGVGRGACLAGEKKFDDARAQMEAVVKQYPEYPRVHYAFGLILLDMSDNEGAIRELKQEIANNASDVISRLQIAAATYKTNSAAGLPYAAEAVRIAPKEPFAHYLFGLLLLDTDDYQKAIPELEIARRAYPNDSKVYIALGSAYSRAGRKEDAARARAEFQRLQKSGQTGASASPEGALETRIPAVEAPAPH